MGRDILRPRERTVVRWHRQCRALALGPSHQGHEHWQRQPVRGLHRRPVNVDTGVLKWHYQMVPGDEWDYDSVQQMILADLNINGKTRKVLMQANKNGFFYVLDRITGEFISAQPFSRVTWASGIDQTTGRPIINTEVKYGKDPTPVSPGGGGAHSWSPMSYNPQTGLVYIPSRGWDTFFYAADYDFKPDASKRAAGRSLQTGLKVNTTGMTRKPISPPSVRSRSRAEM